MILLEKKLGFVSFILLIHLKNTWHCLVLIKWTNAVVQKHILVNLFKEKKQFVIMLCCLVPLLILL